MRRPNIASIVNRMDTTNNVSKAKSDPRPINAQVNALRLKMSLAPLFTFAIAIVLSFGISHAIMSFPGRDKQSDSLTQLLTNYSLWLDTLSTTAGKELDVTATLLALGALTLAIFFPLNASAFGNETAEPITLQAQRIVLNELSIIAAFVTAILAWLTIPLVGLAAANTPAIILATGIAILCSAVIPLHLVRATVLRISLLDARLQRKRVSQQHQELKTTRVSKVAYYLRNRAFMSALSWVLAIGIINLIACTIVVFLTAADRSLEGAIRLALGYSLLTVLWAALTVYMIGETFVSKARGEKFFSRNVTSIFYIILTAFLTLTLWLELAYLSNTLASSILALFTPLVYGTAWVLDRRRTHLLDGYLSWRLTTEARTLKQRIVTLENRLSLTSQIAQPSHYRGGDWKRRQR